MRPCFQVILLTCAMTLAPLPNQLRAHENVISPSNVLVEGEELTYNVRYGFIDLGQVRIRITNKRITPTYLAYSGKALIDSYSGLPFVNLHATFESIIDSSVFSRYFEGRTKDGDHWEFARYRFDYDRARVVTEVGYRDTVIEKRDTLGLDAPCHDGLSLFFYARHELYSGKAMNIPAIVKEKKVNTYIDFKRKRTTVQVDAIPYPVDVIEFQGTADFVGIFGLTGDFEGWFSNDDARIPILAKMKVIIGSVTLELMNWKRPGWSPPKGES
jgi:hypothetical protein